MRAFLILLAAIFCMSIATVGLADKTAGEHVDDTWIHTKVKSAMVGHGSSGVNVEVYDGVVQLAGFVTGEGNKENLVEAARGVKGVKLVSVKIQVVEGDRTAGRTLDDNTLTARVKTNLVDNGLSGINVEVNRGNVLLSGFVKSEDNRKKAVDLTKGLSGVNSVIDGMDLRS